MIRRSVLWAVWLVVVLGVAGGAQAAAPATPPGLALPTWSFTQYAYQAVPDLTTTYSYLYVEGAPSKIWDLDLTTYLTHTYNSDLYITLTSPSGTTVVLSNHSGSFYGNVFYGTLWDDQASSAVTEYPFSNYVTAPWLIPDQKLATFIGENPNGYWLLTIADQVGGDSGFLWTWQLDITGGDTLPSTELFTAANTTPTALVDGSTVTSSVNVSGARPYVVGATVTTNLAHSSNSDLTVRLTSPAGRTTTLTRNNGGASNVFNGTLWDDHAATSATDAFYSSGSVRTPLQPQGSLTGFAGQNPNGTWTLSVADALGGGTGTLNGWTLNLLTMCDSDCQPRLGVSPNALAFGTQPMGLAPAPLTVTLSNTGFGKLIINSLQIAGPNASDFQVTSNVALPYTLVEGGTLPLSVSFAPGGAGPRAAELQVRTNSVAQPVAAVALSGSGMAGNLCPFSVTGSLTSGDPKSSTRLVANGVTSACGSSKGCPGTTTGGNFAYDAYTFTNTAPYAQCMTVTVNGTSCGAAVPVPDIMSFAYLGSFNTSGVSCQNYLADSGSGTAGTTRTYNMTVPAKTNFVVVVQEVVAGSGCTSYTLSVGGCDSPRQLSATPASLFGPTPMGGSQRSSVILSNTGGQALSVTAVGVQGINEADYKVGPLALPLNLAPGASAPVSVTFTPSVPSPRPASLVIASNDPVTPTLMLNLSGVGAAPSATLGPGAGHFGAVPVGNKALRTFSVGNPGLVPVHVTDVHLSGAGGFTLENPPTLPLTLNPDDALGLSVAYVPAAESNDTSTLTVVTDLPQNGTLTAALDGTGTPELLVTPSTLDFSNVSQHAARDAFVTLTNLGSAPISIKAVKSDSPDFVVDASTVPAQLDANASARVRVVFQPSASGAKTANITVDTTVRTAAITAQAKGNAVAAGCGCGAAGAGEALPLLLVAAAGLLRLRRRAQA